MLSVFFSLYILTADHEVNKSTYDYYSLMVAQSKLYSSRNRWMGSRYGETHVESRRSIRGQRALVTDKISAGIRHTNVVVKANSSKAHSHLRCEMSCRNVRNEVKLDWNCSSLVNMTRAGHASRKTKLRSRWNTSATYFKKKLQ